MKKNLGIFDRIMRVIIAIAFAFLILSGTVSGALSLVLGIAGGIFLLTAASGFCPIYSSLGIHTNSMHHHSAH